MAQTRRQFLVASAGAGVGLIGRGRLASADDPPADAPVEAPPTPITRRAGALEGATRGVQVQVVPPPPPPPPERWTPGDFVTNVLVEGRHLAFTFDGGPSPDNTHDVLRALRERGVTATFFLVGINVRAWPQIARDIVDEGHEIGNNSVFHVPYRAASLPQQLVGNQVIIDEETGVRPVVHRAPGLLRGASILAACAEQNVYECHTNVRIADPITPAWSASRLIKQFSANVRNGSMPIFHDGGPSRPTRVAVGALLDIARSRGYALHTATGLVNAGTPVPGRPRYVVRTKADAGRDGLGGSCCHFDVRAGLVARLENPTVKQAERSRIVEQLAILDDHVRAEAD